MWNDPRMLNFLANLLFAAVACACLATGVNWVAHRPLFTLRAIRIEAAPGGSLRHVNALTVRDVALPRVRGNFFTTNLDQVRVAFEAVPWVRRARVQRIWPNGLAVHLEEYVPIGTWGDQGRLVSREGEVFTANLAEAEEDAELIAFSGPEGSEKEVLARYVDFHAWFARIHLAPEAVDYSSRYAWSVRLNNGMRIELGRITDDGILKARVDRLLSVYPQLVANLPDDIESVDLRYPNGLALQSKQGVNLLRKANNKTSGKT
jgi:cell division protein FtsQ